MHFGRHSLDFWVVVLAIEGERIGRSSNLVLGVPDIATSLSIVACSWWTSIRGGRQVTSEESDSAFGNRVRRNDLSVGD